MTLIKYDQLLMVIMISRKFDENLQKTERVVTINFDLSYKGP